MYYRVIRNDVVKSKAITLTTMLFVAAAAMLVALAAVLVVNLSGAIDTLMPRAQTPHFMQMHAGAPGEKAADVEAYLQAQMERHPIPGLALVVVTAAGETTIYTAGEARPGIPVTETTRFYMGSLSKALTATAVLQLAEAGQIDLDTAVQTYLPDFTTRNPAHAAAITVRHLLNHTSGLSDAGYNSLTAPRQATLAGVVGDLARAEAAAAPGTQFAYFNPNYDLLGRLVEVASGMAYADYLQQRLFTPLQMEQAAAGDTFAAEELPGLAQGHILLYGWPVAYRERLNVYAPAGGIIASATDMGAFLHSFFPGSPSALLRQETITTMVLPPAGVESDYGMGWFQATLPDGTAILTHGGDMQTMHADMVFMPEAQVAFALLYNRQNLLSTFTGYPEIRNGVAYLLRGADAPEGISGALLGILLAGVSLLLVVDAARRLLRHPQWLESRRASSPTGIVVGALLPLWPLLSLLLLPTLILWVNGRAIDYDTLFAYLPDVVILLVLTGCIGGATTLARLLSIGRIKDVK